MKKIITLLFLVCATIGFSSCTKELTPLLLQSINTPATESEMPAQTSNAQEEIKVGGDRDEHGCIGSAGYTWCEIKQTCLRIWEEPCASAETELEVLKTAVLDQIVAKRGQGAKNLVITVQKVDGDYAQGGAKPDNEDAGGGMWFAARVDSKWQLAWDGNGIISCMDLKPYPQFPSTMIPECFDETTQQLIQR